MRVPQINQENMWKWDKNLHWKMLCWNDNILAVLMYEGQSWSLQLT
jgi:hypothetical protein